MICKKCGGQSPEGSKFCLNCGAPFETVEEVIKDPVNETPLVEETKQAEEVNKEKKSSNKQIITIALLVVVIIVAGILVVKGLSSFTASSNNETSYYIAKTEDDLVFYLDGEEQYRVEYDGYYNLSSARDEDYFILYDDEDNDVNYTLRYIDSESGEEMEIEDDVVSYSAQIEGKYIAYAVFDDDEYKIMYGTLKKQEEIATTDSWFVLSPDGKAILYQDDNDVYLYDGKESEKMVKDAYIWAFIDKDEFLVRKENNSTFSYFNGDEEIELVENFSDVEFLNEDNTKALVIGNYDEGSDAGTLYYYSDFSEEAVTVTNDCDGFEWIDEEIFIVDDGDLYQFNEKTPEDLTLVLKDYINFYDFAIYDEYIYFIDEGELHKNEFGSKESEEIDLDEDINEFYMNEDGDIAFINYDYELFIYNGKKIIEIDDDIYSFIIDKDYVVYLNDDDELMVTDLKGKDFTTLNEDIDMYTIVDGFVYAINYDDELFIAEIGDNYKEILDEVETYRIRAIY